MAFEHFIPSKFVFSADYTPVIKNFPMLAALAEACLWPVVLILFDDQFVPRLSNLYRRQSASDRAKPPQGKIIIITTVLLVSLNTFKKGTKVQKIKNEYLSTEVRYKLIS